VFAKGAVSWTLWWFSTIPRAGMLGDDHMMIRDTNSDEIAGLLLKWIE
jgi:hypothetical protein